MSINKHLKGESLVDSSEDLNVKTMATRIERTVEENDARDSSKAPLAHTLPEFTGRKLKTSASEFVERIAKFGRCSPSCFTLSMVYLGRIRRSSPGLCLQSENFQRLLGSLVMLASKFVDDQFYSNCVWAQVVGIPVAELNMLELVLLKQLDFRLVVSQQEYRLFSQEFFSINATKMDPIDQDHEQTLTENYAVRKMHFDPEMESSVNFDSAEESSLKLKLRRGQSREERARVFNIEFGQSQSGEEQPQDFKLIESCLIQSGVEPRSQVVLLDSDSLPPFLPLPTTLRHDCGSGFNLHLNSDSFPLFCPDLLQAFLDSDSSASSPTSSESSNFHFGSSSTSGSCLGSGSDSSFNRTLFPEFEITRSWSLEMDGFNMRDNWSQRLENATQPQLENVLKNIATVSGATPLIKGCWESGAEFKMKHGRTRTFTISEIL